MTEIDLNEYVFSERFKFHGGPDFVADRFPWVNPVNKKLTVKQLLDKRYTIYRGVWGRVLTGTVDQLVEAFRPHDILQEEYVKYMIRQGRIDYLFECDLGPIHDEWAAFRVGYLLGLQKMQQLQKEAA